ncbi:MAG: hypothetical protein IT557_13065 [Alphaproteobacteria bacterium]|nr:hypothetical protein [Alphaproteobacteria bacterium]
MTIALAEAAPAAKPPPPAPADGALPLDNLAVIGGIVSGFARGVVERLAACIEDALTMDEALATADRTARAVGAVLLGHHAAPPFTVRPWNAPDMMGAHIVRALGLEVAPEDAVRALLLILAERLTEAAIAPPEQFAAMARELVSEASLLLAGRFPHEIQRAAA